MPMSEQYVYDVFISFAGEDRIWTEEQVLRRLQRCRTMDGRMPRIFFDRSRTGVQTGEPWGQSLANAVLESRKFVAIYSRSYFSKPACNYELEAANELDLDRRMRLINPVLYDLTLEKVPLRVASAQYIRIDWPDWFERLCDALELTPAREVLTLGFKGDLPSSIEVNNTLPPVRIEVYSDSGGRGRDVAISISTKTGDLRGELTVISRNGVAEFSDLSFAEPHDKPVSLFASADGCISASSKGIQVLRPAVPEIPAGVSIDATGNPFFFCKGEALALITEDCLAIWSIEGRQVGKSFRFDAPLRFIVRDQDHIAVADWAGHVRIIAQDGQISEWDFGAQDEKLAIPGGMVLSERHLFLGFWNGNLYRLQPDNERELIGQHAAGVQALAAIGNRIVVVDLEGKLVMWEADRVIFSSDTGERCIHGMKTVGDGVIFVGENHLLKFAPQTKSIFREALRLCAPLTTLTDVDCPLICDDQGRGFRFNAGLTREIRFQVPPGARPVSADHSGKWAVFRQPDGTHTLLRRHQVVYTHHGPLAVSPDGHHFAIGEHRRLRLLDENAIHTLISGRENG